MLKKNLSKNCDDASDVLLKSIVWLSDNSDSASQDTSDLQKKLKKSVLKTKKLGDAASTKMTTGVFGVSQAGKSYLISVLARKNDTPLIAKFGNDEVDFIENINPPGGRESTGVVTRFSIEPPLKVISDFPIEIKLLTEPDLVRLLANSYVMDIDHDDETEDDHNVVAIMEELDHIAKSAGSMGEMDEYDILDLEDYCNNKLIKSSRIKVLKRIGFWDKARQIIQSCDDRLRARLFSIIWGHVSVFDTLFFELQQALKQLGYSRLVYCSSDGLYNNTAGGFSRLQEGLSIVDVLTLKGIGTGSSSDTVQVFVPERQSFEIPRCQLTALIAELRVTIRDIPHELFTETDLLDFPGARSRPAKKITENFLNDSSTFEHLFVRGKVAFLFDRYCDNYDLNTLMLCSGPENMEVIELPEMLNDWIETTQGRDAQERQNTDVSLFFVLTKFDMSFAQGAGKSTDVTRWTARMDTSLLKSFGDRFSWPTEWSTNETFKNVFCLRNPNFRQDGLFEYTSSDSLIETGIRHDKLGFIETLRDSFLDCPEVNNHFYNPSDAWEAVFKLNDGGVNYLLSKLQPLCLPILKYTQVNAELERIIDSSVTSLSPYYISSDINIELEKKRKVIKGLSITIAKIIKNQQFGKLMEILQVDENEVYDVFLLASGFSDIESSNDPQDKIESEYDLIGSTIDDQDLLGELFGDEEEEKEVKADTAPSINAKSIEHKLTDALKKYWQKKLTTIQDSHILQHYFSMSENDADNLKVELEIGADRLNVFAQIAKEMEQTSLFRSYQNEQRIWRQVVPACEQLNQYVAWLGYGGKEKPQGTEITYTNKIRHVFSGERVEIGDYPDLGTEPMAYDRTYYADWLFSFSKLSEENVIYSVSDDKMINVEQNTKLGDYLTAFNNIKIS